MSTKLEELKRISGELCSLILAVGNTSCPEFRQLRVAVDYLDDVATHWRAEELKAKRDAERRAAELAAQMEQEEAQSTKGVKGSPE